MVDEKTFLIVKRENISEKTLFDKIFLLQSTKNVIWRNDFSGNIDKSFIDLINLLQKNLHPIF